MFKGIRSPGPDPSRPWRGSHLAGKSIVQVLGQG